MKLFCRHDWELLEGTVRIYASGFSKEAKYKCNKCNKERRFDIFKRPKNTYVFKEYNKTQISDGYHTFEELYHHRMVLFSIICNANKNKAWKSWKHEDGTMYDDYFIVGITTPRGDYTYHYQSDYWHMFKVREIPNAPEWDGHKPSDIDRLIDIVEEQE